MTTKSIQQKKEYQKKYFQENKKKILVSKLKKSRIELQNKLEELRPFRKKSDIPDYIKYLEDAIRNIEKRIKFYEK